MSFLSTRSRKALALCAGLLASQVLLVTFSPPAASDRTCTALREWARGYEHQSPTLDHLAQFDRGHRLAIFNAVTPAMRAALWREQLRRFALRRDLSQEQRAFIEEARAALSPATYEQPATARRESVRLLWARAEPLFPSGEQRRVWFDLGAVAMNTPARTPSLLDRLTASYRAGAQDVPYCECSAAYGGMECYPGGCVSSFCRNWEGCGPMGWDMCAGRCTF